MPLSKHGGLNHTWARPKIWGGGAGVDWDGYKENFRGESKNVIKFYSRFVNILRVGSKNFTKMPFWTKFSNCCRQFFWAGRGVKAKGFVRCEGSRLSSHPIPSHPLESYMVSIGHSYLDYLDFFENWSWLSWKYPQCKYYWHSDFLFISLHQDLLQFGNSQQFTLSVFLSFCLSGFLSICFSVFLFFCLSGFLSLYLYLCFSLSHDRGISKPRGLYMP